VLTVQDDGAGFDPSVVSGAKLGLIGMRQRAELLGGEMEISSSPGAGTCVRVVLPVSSSAE
jgi:signal transduction histidine kinase